MLYLQEACRGVGFQGQVDTPDGLAVKTLGSQSKLDVLEQILLHRVHLRVHLSQHIRATKALARCERLLLDLVFQALHALLVAF